MSSTNDTYQHLLVQTQLKSILKKSPSPRFKDPKSNMNTDDPSSNIILSSNDIDESTNNSRFIETNNSNLSSVEIPSNQLIMKSNEKLRQHEIDTRRIRTLPPADSSSLTSDDDQQPNRIKSKKNYYRPSVATGTLSSSSDNDERQAKRSMRESKTTLRRSSKHQPKDMQLDEFMRMYQHQGGIYVSTNDDHGKEQITTKDPINNNGNNYHRSTLTKQRNSQSNSSSINLINDDTISLLQSSIDTITLTSKSNSPLQLLFDVARTSQVDRRTKIDQIRQYVEEQIGISAFLTIYKLIKSSQIPIDIKQKPFCHYAIFIPHLCCLIMLESQQQKTR